MFGYQTLPELANTLEVKPWVLDFLVRTRQINHIKVGNTRLYGPEAIQKIKQELNARKAPEPSAPALGPAFPALLGV